MSATNRGGNRERLDRYYTPDDLAVALTSLLPIQAGETVLEPSAGGGAFTRALVGRGCRVSVVDIDPAARAFNERGTVGGYCGDFLEYERGTPVPFDWVVGNPPYGNAEAHVRKAIDQGANIAFLLRLGFLESAKRLPFWNRWKARHVWVLAERPSFTGGGTDATAYGFFWWDVSHYGPTQLDVISWRGKPDPVALQLPLQGSR